MKLYTKLVMESEMHCEITNRNIRSTAKYKWHQLVHGTWRLSWPRSNLLGNRAEICLVNSSIFNSMFMKFGQIRLAWWAESKDKLTVNIDDTLIKNQIPLFYSNSNKHSLGVCKVICYFLKVCGLHFWAAQTEESPSQKKIIA